MFRFVLRLTVPLLLLIAFVLAPTGKATGVATASPASQGMCVGDEYIAFNPYGPEPSANRDLYIIVSSVSPNLSGTLSGPFEPVFGGVGHDQRQRPDGGWDDVYTWTWKATPTAPGSYDYTFSVDGAQCVAGTVMVAPTPAPLAPLVLAEEVVAPLPRGICNGDERLAFNPYRSEVTADTDMYIVASSVHPAVNVNLVGPLDPTFGGVGRDFRQRADGQWEEVYTWTWKATPPVAGRYDYVFSVDGTICTADFVEVGEAPALPN